MRSPATVRAAVLGYLEIILVEAGNGLALLVCDSHIHHDDAAFCFDDGALDRRGNGRPLFTGLREAEPCEKEKRGSGD